MASYIKLSTKEYPRHEGDIRLEHPEIGELFECPSTYALVLENPEPPYDCKTQTCRELQPEFIDGNWVRKFEIINLTNEEIQLNEKITLFYKNKLHSPITDFNPDDPTTYESSVDATL